MNARLYPTAFALSILAALSPIEGAKLKSGPMLGYSTMKEVLIWVQTDSPAEVRIKYWEQGSPRTAQFTDVVRTQKSTAFVAQCRADVVTWSRVYNFAVIIDGKEAAPRFRKGYKDKGPIPLSFQTQPRWRHAEAADYRPPDFRVALGSCAYLTEEGYNWEENDTPFGGEYGIFESIYEQDPDLMIWLGDQIYLREADWTTKTGIYHRYDHYRSFPHLRALFATVHHYAIWDDHDFGPNDIGRTFWNKEATLAAFKLYWGNPSYGFQDMPGITTFFNWGDVNFYLLDNRFHRVSADADPEPFGIPKSHHGKKQIDWLVETMRYQQGQDGFVYSSSFNIVVTGNQVISDHPNPDGFRNYEGEWQYMIDRIIHAGIDGVVFLSGDVHYTEFSKEVRVGGGEPGTPGKAGKPGAPYVFYDLTVSPLTSGVFARPSDNSHRLDIFPDSDRDFIAQRNFATLDFKGEKNDRRIEIRIYDSSGDLINRKKDGNGDEIDDIWILKANDLRAP